MMWSLLCFEAKSAAVVCPQLLRTAPSLFTLLMPDFCVMTSGVEFILGCDYNALRSLSSAFLRMEREMFRCSMEPLATTDGREN
jgi:hypothetical protein